MIYLVRHAHAGSKAAWAGPDQLRPLSPKGHSQVPDLLARLRPHRVTRIVCSPTVRCRQTVQPLAEERGQRVVDDTRLGVRASSRQIVRMVFDPAMDGAVLCTHGELIGRLFDALRARGATIDDDAPYAKGSVWLLHVMDGRVTEARYLPPRLVTLPAARCS